MLRTKFKKKLRIDLKWLEMRSKVMFGHPKWPPASILWTKLQKNKCCILIWNVEKGDWKWFSVIQNGQREFWERNSNKKSCLLIWNSEKCNLKWFMVVENCRRRPFCKKCQRKSDEKACAPYNLLHRSFLHSGPNLWMSLNDHIQSSRTKTTFKRRITHNYIKEYQNRNIKFY